MKKIKNADSMPHTWVGMEIQPGEQYEIQGFEEGRWANNSHLLIDIAIGKAVVNNGTSDIYDVAQAINHLKDGIAKPVEIQKQPEPYPFAQPTHRTKRSATNSLVGCPINTSTTIDFLLTEERYASGGCLIVENAQFGDYMTAEVCDIDGIIPSIYRTTLCENWPTVARYIEKEWIRCAGGPITIHDLDTRPLTAKITAGLYLRITYHAINAGSARQIGVNYDLTKKLV